MSKLITEIEAEAIAISEKGGQGLFLFDRKRCGKLYDQDRARIVQTVLAVGMSLQGVRVKNDCKENQHIELADTPLKKVFMAFEPKKRTRKTVKIEKSGAVGPSEAMGDVLRGDDDVQGMSPSEWAEKNRVSKDEAKFKKVDIPDTVIDIAKSVQPVFQVARDSQAIDMLRDDEESPLDGDALTTDGDDEGGDDGEN